MSKPSDASRAEDIVRSWLHGSDEHRQWLRDIAEPDIAKALEAAREEGRAEAEASIAKLRAANTYEDERRRIAEQDVGIVIKRAEAALEESRQHFERGFVAVENECREYRDRARAAEANVLALRDKLREMRKERMWRPITKDTPRDEIFLVWGDICKVKVGTLAQWANAIYYQPSPESPPPDSGEVEPDEEIALPIASKPPWNDDMPFGPGVEVLTEPEAGE